MVSRREVVRFVSSRLAVYAADSVRGAALNSMISGAFHTRLLGRFAVCDRVTRQELNSRGLSSKKRQNLKIPKKISKKNPEFDS